MPATLAFLPPLVALGVILWRKNAALGLAAACLTGSALLAGPSPIAVLKDLVASHLFPSILGSAWNVGAIIFTLTLGAFAALIERGGGFTALLTQLQKRSHGDPQKRLMGGVYGLGLLCFFDGLANALLLGRIARPLADGVRVSRQFLAYVIDSTSSAVACVAFISTWIATQLSLIDLGLADAPFDVNPATLFFSSIPANPYCLLTLLLVPLAIRRGYRPSAMGRATAHESAAHGSVGRAGSARSALIPLAALVIAVPLCIYFWQDGPERSWRAAFSSSGVPYAMVTAAVIGVAVAWICYPRARRSERGAAAQEGAAALLPALLILMLAWTVGSQLKALGTAAIMGGAISGWVSADWLPFAIFLLGAAMSFLTGTAWGTMGLLMPLMLPVALQLGADLPPDELMELCSAAIGAVFGGAVFGDHCSPFSDTTIIASLAAGCSPSSHVITQLPYAFLTVGAAALAYAGLALGLPATAATVMAAVILVEFVMWRTRA